MVLAAGYATRLYPLTENFPKALLAVGGKDHSRLAAWTTSTRTCEITPVCRRIESQVHQAISANWADGRKTFSAPIHRSRRRHRQQRDAPRGSAGRPVRALTSFASTRTRWLIVGRQRARLLARQIRAIMRAERQASCLMRYREAERKTGCASAGSWRSARSRTVSRAWRKSPPNRFRSGARRRFTSIGGSDLPLVREGHTNPASTWTRREASWRGWRVKTDVRAMEMPGKRYDIGDIESYRSVCAAYRGHRGKRGGLV